MLLTTAFLLNFADDLVIPVVANGIKKKIKVEIIIPDLYDRWIFLKSIDLIMEGRLWASSPLTNINTKLQTIKYR
jgi:hypothetical protein